MLLFCFVVVRVAPPTVSEAQRSAFARRLEPCQKALKSHGIDVALTLTDSTQLDS